jgi:hypothetical protein
MCWSAIFEEGRINHLAPAASKKPPGHARNFTLETPSGQRIAQSRQPLESHVNRKSD